MLTEEQKRSRLDISRYLLSRYENDPEEFMDRSMTQDETWVPHVDPKSKKHLRNFGEFLRKALSFNGNYGAHNQYPQTHIQ